MRRNLIILLIGSLSGLFLRFLLQAELEQPLWSFGELIYWAFLGVILAVIAYWVSRSLDQIIPWDERPGRRWFIGWLANTAGLSILAFVANVGYQQWVQVSVLDNLQTEALLLKGGVILAFLILSYSVVYFAIQSYRHFGQLRLQSLREERERMDLQWQSLRAQLHPHFLFNNLNTISALVEEDEQRAEIFIRKLAHTYRFMLRSYDEPSVLLRKEMKLVEAYFFLLETRYPGSLRLETDLIKAAIEKRVPPLAIQLLVENAVKHNKFSKERPLVIRISCDEQYLWVQNDFRPRNTERASSFAVGLANLSARYRLLEATEPEIRKGQVFTVKIPLLS